MSNPVPRLSVPDIRDTFTRMNMDDRWDNLISKSWPLLIPRETVALIGGGHAFGKTHGACTNGAGPKPVEDPVNPWPGEHHNVHDHDASYCDNVSPSVWPSLSGMCGSGKLGDAFTSGFEFPFTSNPTRWDNEYFVNLEHYQVWNMIFNLIWGRVTLYTVSFNVVLYLTFSVGEIYGTRRSFPMEGVIINHHHHHPNIITIITLIIIIIICTILNIGSGCWSISFSTFPKSHRDSGHRDAHHVSWALSLLLSS